MPGQRTIIDDEQESHAKTSLRMTRSMSEDIGLKIKKIMEDIDNNKVNLSYTEWQWFISQCWNDEIWIMAINKAIRQCKEYGIDLNRNKEFLNLIAEMTPFELKNEFRKTHPIARLSLMDIVDKKPPKPKKDVTLESLFP